MSGARVEAGGLVQGESLSGFDWTDADLTETAFVDCLIEGAQLSGVTLTGARFQRCRILRCRFAHADLREASFEDCAFADPETRTGMVATFSNLEMARFARCDLTLSLFDRSGLHAIEMQACNLRGARFEKADFAKSFGRKVVRTLASFRDCNLELADLSGAHLTGCSLTGCDLRDADLADADLEGADLSGANLFRALVAGAKLAGADLRGAEISGLDLAVLATREGLIVTADQQHALLTALGIDVRTS
jgi:fluoroquinolone resistance protein